MAKRAALKYRFGGWAGFSEGKLDIIEVDTGWGGFGMGSMARVPAIFASRKEARRQYQDVRRVSIKEPGHG